MKVGSDAFTHRFSFITHHIYVAPSLGLRTVQSNQSRFHSPATLFQVRTT